jgi:hypothetical protein
MDRDRAWRRRKSKIVSNREQETRDTLSRVYREPAAAGPAPTPRPQRPGKLTPAQSMRQGHQLAYEMADGWVEPPDDLAMNPPVAEEVPN